MVDFTVCPNQPVNACLVDTVGPSLGVGRETFHHYSISSLPPVWIKYCRVWFWIMSYDVLCVLFLLNVLGWFFDNLDVGDPVLSMWLVAA